jgi:hypothetical protein
MHGDGLVVNRQVLTQLVQIRCDDDTLATVVLEDVFEINGVPVPGAVRERPPEPEPPPSPAPRGRRDGGGGRGDRKPRGRSGQPGKVRTAPRTPGSPEGTDAALQVNEKPASSDGTTDAGQDGADRKKPRRRRGRRGGRRGPKPGGSAGSSGGAPSPGSG